MELFRFYYFIIFISFLFPIEDRVNSIINFSSSDFSIIDNSEFQFNMGIQSNHLVGDFYFFSVDKLISGNLFLSTKISKFQNNDLEIFNQNSISYSSQKHLINYSFSFNYLTDNNIVNRWNSFGMFIDYNINTKIILLSGIYFDFTNFDNKNWDTTNYYISSKLKLSHNIASIISLTYNHDYSITNQSLVFSIKL